MIEYEATFPFEDTNKFPLSVISSSEAYTREEITEILRFASNAGEKPNF